MHVSLARSARLVALGFASLAAVAGMVIGAGPASAATHHVTISTYSYHPAALTVAAGDTVTWTNLDSVAHDVTVTRGPVLFHSPMLSQGQSWSYVFTVAGPYTYICSVHPDMTATLTVQPAPVRPVAPVIAPTHAASKAAATVHQPVVATSTPTPALALPATTTAASSSGSTQINPLLLVGGALCAVVIFCLLVMASRPQVAVAEGVPIDDAQELVMSQASPPPPPGVVR